MGIFSDVIYPLKKRLEGASSESSSNRFWQELSALENRVPGGTFDAYNEQLAKLHIEMLKPHLPQRPLVVLDLGCGYGHALRHFKAELGDQISAMTGVDGYDAVLESARLVVPTASFEKFNLFTNISKLPESLRGRADLLICSGTLQAIPEEFLPNTFAIAHAMLKPGGLLLLAWMSPYYIDQTWVVPFLLNHRHRMATVARAVDPYFSILPTDPDIVNRLPVKAKRTGLIGILRKLLTRFHPREMGTLVCQRKANSLL